MSLVSGSRIGSYEVLAILGAGGMGEVYRARDTKLGRDVALKVLPDVFAGDADRLARFQREAQLFASLNLLPASASGAGSARSASPQITVVLNWFEELKTRVPIR